MVSREQTSADVPSEVGGSTTSQTSRVRAGTPILVWVVYVLGLLAAMAFLVSAVFVALVYLTSDGGGSDDLDISVRALVVWAGLLIAAAATWLWRRSQAAR